MTATYHGSDLKAALRTGLDVLWSLEPGGDSEAHPTGLYGFWSDTPGIVRNWETLVARDGKLVAKRERKHWPAAVLTACAEVRP